MDSGTCTCRDESPTRSRESNPITAFVRIYLETCTQQKTLQPEVSHHLQLALEINSTSQQQRMTAALYSFQSLPSSHDALFSPCSTCTALPSPPQRRTGEGRLMFHFLSSPLPSAHSSTHLFALCYSSRHRHQGHIKMCLSSPHIHLSALKQQNQSMKLNGIENCFFNDLTSNKNFSTTG